MDDEAERSKLREVSKRLYAQMQEAEKKHLEEKERLQVTYSLCIHCAYYIQSKHIHIYIICMKAIFRTKLFDQSRLKAAGLESV